MTDDLGARGEADEPSADAEVVYVEIWDLPVAAWTTPTGVGPAPRGAPRPPAPLPPSGIADVSSLGDPVAMLSGSLRLEREQHRSRITEGLLLAYFFGVAALLLLVGLDRVTVDESLHISSAFVTPAIALLGACVGHYFARKSGGG